jgi:hypothetical protein
LLVETEGQGLRNFGRDTNHLLAAEEPVDARGNKIQSLLVLGERIVLMKVELVTTTRRAELIWTRSSALPPFSTEAAIVRGSPLSFAASNCSSVSSSEL